MIIVLVDGGTGTELRARGAEAVRRWIDRGATIVGGCCSTRPAYIARPPELIG